MEVLSWLGAGLALASGLVWGSGDFAGGLASRRINSVQVSAVTALVGLIGMAGLGVLLGERWPDLRETIWSACGGAAGAIGILALYRALASGHMAIVAPTTAVVGAGLPVIVGAFTDGLPTALRLLGFALGLLGIGLASRPGGEAGQFTPRATVLAVLAGVGFGLFFVCMAQVTNGLVFWPLAIARLIMFTMAAGMLASRKLALPSLRANPLALLSGLFDTGGNLLYLLAKQYTRLDVSAVLSSLYPVSTVLLARVFLRERLSRGQMLGVTFALLAVVMIAA